MMRKQYNKSYTSAMFLGMWRYRRFHVSYFLAWFAAGILAGLLVGRQFDVEPQASLIAAMLVLVLGAFRSRRWWGVIAIIVAGGIGGVIRGSGVDAEYGRYELLIGRTVTIEGVMSGDAQRTNGGRQKITLTRISAERSEYVGEIFATVYGDAELKRGDRVTLRGTIREGFASYAAALSGGKVISVARSADTIRDIRERFASTVRAVIVEPIASLGLGFVVGQRSTLPDTLDEQLKVVGLTHIVVASGYNLTILVRFMMRLLSRHSRYLALASSLVMITLFVLFSGFSPSMNRAVVVTVLGLLAWYVGRRFHPVLLLMYVAAATAFVKPMYVWSDLGWYLSFFAFAGILIVAPLVVAYLYKRRAPSSFEQLVTETLSAEIMALPLIAFAFGTVPVLGLIANVLVAPFIPAAMALTALTGALGFVFIPLAAILALPTMVLIGYMVAVVEWLAGLSFAQYIADIGLAGILLWYIVVISLCLAARHKTGYDFRARDRRLEV